jgi:Holliday junction resolvase RusA-like endonuclease
VKGIKDAVKGIIWKDDSCVVSLDAMKYYSENPRVEVEIREVG